jgi:gamma-glutamylcyclotransferase (GGCT)/AIG2-like uncharacterized protein YtfP
MTGQTHLFIYGTLKRGQPNHDWLADGEYLGPAETLPHYRLINCGPYPGLLIDRESGKSVVGELWKVGAETLQRLDLLEGVPTLYALEAIELVDHAGPVFAYFYQADTTGLPDCGHAWPPN